MPEFYFDIETLPKGEKPSYNDKIISIQFWRLSTETGKPHGELTILKAWESSERAILQQFYDIFCPKKPFHFIPIGMNLNYDLVVLHHRWKKYGINVPLELLFYEHPRLDIKPILVLLNDGQFKGASLEKFTGKESGQNVPLWYIQRRYELIEEYIKKEAQKFVRFYQKLKKEITKLNTLYGESL